MDNKGIDGTTRHIVEHGIRPREHPCQDADHKDLYERHASDFLFTFAKLLSGLEVRYANALATAFVETCPAESKAARTSLERLIWGWAHAGVFLPR